MAKSFPTKNQPCLSPPSGLLICSVVWQWDTVRRIFQGFEMQCKPQLKRERERELDSDEEPTMKGRQNAQSLLPSPCSDRTNSSIYVEQRQKEKKATRIATTIRHAQLAILAFCPHCYLSNTAHQLNPVSSKVSARGRKSGRCSSCCNHRPFTSSIERSG